MVAFADGHAAQLLQGDLAAEDLAGGDVERPGFLVEKQPQFVGGVHDRRLTDLAMEVDPVLVQGLGGRHAALRQLRRGVENPPLL